MPTLQKLLLFFLINLLGLPITVFAGLDHRPRYYYQAPQSREAFKQSRALAEKGDALAQYTLCLAYRFGKYVRKSADKTLFWCKTAANQGLQQAQNYLGYMYLDGNMVEKDYTQALHWFQIASAQNYKDSQYYLGQMYEYGWGVNRDHDKAIYFYQLSAAQNDYYAKKALNDILHRYRDFEKKLPLARQGDKWAQWDNCTVCLDIYRGQVIRKECSEAIDWLTSSAEQGNSLSQKYLALFYLHGKHVEQNYSKALYFFQLAAEQRDSSSQYFIATMYEQGLGVDKNQSEAIRWYQLSAERGHQGARDALRKIRYGFLGKWISKTFQGLP